MTSGSTPAAQAAHDRLHLAPPIGREAARRVVAAGRRVLGDGMPDDVEHHDRPPPSGRVARAARAARRSDSTSARRVRRDRSAATHAAIRARSLARAAVEPVHERAHGEQRRRRQLRGAGVAHAARRPASRRPGARRARPADAPAVGSPGACRRRRAARASRTRSAGASRARAAGAARRPASRRRGRARPAAPRGQQRPEEIAATSPSRTAAAHPGRDGLRAGRAAPSRRAAPRRSSRRLQLRQRHGAPLDDDVLERAERGARRRRRVGGRAPTRERQDVEVAHAADATTEPGKPLGQRPDESRPAAPARRAAASPAAGGSPRAAGGPPRRRRRAAAGASRSNAARCRPPARGARRRGHRRPATARAARTLACTRPISGDGIPAARRSSGQRAARTRSGRLRRAARAAPPDDPASATTSRPDVRLPTALAPRSRPRSRAVMTRRPRVPATR